MNILHLIKCQDIKLSHVYNLLSFRSTRSTRSDAPKVAKGVQDDSFIAEGLSNDG